MVLTSPPYDNLRDYKGYTFDFESIAKELYRITKQGGVVVWVVGDATIKGSETGTSFKQALYFKEIGFNLHDTMIWEKPSCLPTQDRYYAVFEYMFVFSKGKPKTMNFICDNINKAPQRLQKKDSVIAKNNPKKTNETFLTGAISRRKNIWVMPVARKNYGHRAVFPEKLAEDHILSWSNEGDTVLDPMAGSGTTLKMAKKNNRNYIGIEISQEYIDIINKRLAPTD
jgi:site-specific DNA-methyltransferase (adenine-specific)